MAFDRKEKWRPTLSMIVAVLLASILLLPLAGIIFFRLYENHLVRSTEAELIAQTAGISNGLERIRKHGIDSEKKGWLVRIKKSRFFIDEIPIETRIVTHTEKIFEYDGFREMKGTARIGEKIVCEASLQVFQPEAD